MESREELNSVTSGSEISYLIETDSLESRGLHQSLGALWLQDSPVWELIINVTGHEPTRDEIYSFTQGNPRIKVVLKSLEPHRSSTAGILGIIKPGVALLPSTTRLAVELLREPNWDYAYGDTDEFFRPDWSPIRYHHLPYCSDLVFRNQRSGNTKVVRHLSRTFTRHSAHSIGACKWLQDLVEDQQPVGDEMTISVVIPTRGATLSIYETEVCLVEELISSIRDEFEYLHEILIVADKSTPPVVLQRLQDFPLIKVIAYDEEFNFSRKCNIAAEHATGDILLLLNDDMESLSPGWPKTIKAYLANDRHGAVGGLLLTPDGLVQCAGHSNSPVPHLYGSGLNPKFHEDKELVSFPRECSGLPGALLALRRELYFRVGGLCESLPNSYNDVDLGFKLLREQKHLIYSPEIRFLHHESASRIPIVDDHANSLIQRRWGSLLRRDPFPPPLNIEFADVPN
jgi:GT2 family glycosyltransferase